MIGTWCPESGQDTVRKFCGADRKDHNEKGMLGMSKAVGTLRMC